MSWLQFLDGVISSIAWPAVVMAAVLVFKDQIGQIIQRLAHVKYKDVELDFERVKQQAADLQLASEEQPPSPPVPALASLEDQVMDAVERAPAAAVLLAWSGVEAAMATAVARLAISAEAPSYRSPMHNIDVLARHGGLSKQHERLLHEMRSLRNQVAHEGDAIRAISQTQALDYATTAIDLINLLDRQQRRD